MFTRWEKFSTSFEFSPQTSTNEALILPERSAKKINAKTKKSLTHCESSTSSLSPGLSGIAASFVQPMTSDDPLYQERVNSKPENSKKRRKNRIGNAEGVGCDGSGGNHHDVEPILCVTSPHRVVFMGRKNGGPKGLDRVGVSLIESKENSYFARPGIGSQFFIRGNEAGCFSGMVPAGAQYDPSSNFTYALRNGGAELAVWAAVPSSVLSGPDDEIQGSMVNGVYYQDKIAEGNQGSNSKKRKSLGYAKNFNSSGDEISIHHLRFPTGKKALTLTPFHIPKSNGSNDTIVIGAAGCCEDGSVWVASRLSKSSSRFELTFISDFIGENGVENGNRNMREKDKSPEAKLTLSNEKVGWKVIDSNVVGACPKDEKSGSMTNCIVEFVLMVQAVFISEQLGEVQYRYFQLCVGHGKDKNNLQTNGSKNSLSYLVEKMTCQKILRFEENSDTNIAAKIARDGKSLSIVHGHRERGWMFMSATLSFESGMLANSISSFSIPGGVTGGGGVDLANSATVISFGRLGGHIFAILTKHSESSESLFSMRIVDVRKKAELFATVWSEGIKVDGVDATSKTGPLAKLLQGKRCVAMITNEFDGSIYLFASPHDGKVTLDIICSKFDCREPSHLQAFPGKTLASALRVMASSSTMAAEKGNTLDAAKLTPICNLAIPGILDVAKPDHFLDHNSFHAACILLGDASSNLIEFFTNAECKSQREENGNIGANLPISWSATYHQGLKLITGEHASRKCKENAPIEFIESALKNSIAILLSLKKPLETSKLKKGQHVALQEVSSVLLEVIKSGHVSARKNYGFGSNYVGNIFLSILRAYLPGRSSHESVRIEIISAMLEHIKDIPEQVLVSILRFVLRNVEIDDIVTYYSKESDPGKTSRLSRLSTQYMGLKSEVPQKADSQIRVDKEKNLTSRIMSLAILDITSKIITYSRCNHSFLTKAMRDGLKSNAEVEALLISLSKLLQFGNGHDDVESFKSGMTLSMGAVEWISALADAHLGTILKISLNGGLIIDRIQNAVRSALVQSEFSNEAKELLDHIETVTENAKTMKDESNPSLRETAVLYSIERLAF
ncbi:hypothetical protein ACHAXS_005931 [Conticribra weissflogii]